MEPTPPGAGHEPVRQFMREVETQVVAGLVLALAAGVGYLVYQIPRSLDLVLANQRAMADRAAAIEVRVTKTEEKLPVIDRRVTTLEAQ